MIGKAYLGVALLLALVLAATALGGRVGAQGPVRPGPEAFMLEGPGSSIGISVRDLTKEEAEKAGPPQTGGAIVTSVVPGGPGARAGLRIGDRVIEFDGERVRSARHLTRLVRETPQGRSVKSSLVREGTRQTLDITPDGRTGIGEFPQIGRDLERQLRDLPRSFSFDIGPGILMRRGRLGTTLSPLGDQLASFFGVKQGVLVSSVDPDSPAARAGLKAGDVIVAVNGRMVAALSDVTEQVVAAQPGSTLEVRVVRDKKEITLQTTMPERERPRPAESRRSREI